MLVLVIAFLALGAVAVTVLPKKAAPLVALVSVGASMAEGLADVRQLLRGRSPQGLGGMLRLDGPGTVVFLLVLTLGFFAALVSSQTERWPRRFYALLLTFTATMTLAALADNLGLLWASVEATTLSSALLVGHHRTKQATEAAWKYLILSSTGILFAFLATIALVLASRGAGGPTLSYAELTSQAPRIDPGLVRLAVILAMVGYGTKAGLVPYHFWLPDAHSEAPSPVSAILSGVLLSCALLAVDRFTRIGRLAGVPLEHLHLGIGALSVLVGGALVLGAQTYKRMLAYSSVENMGLVVFAVGLGTPLAMAGAYLHILTHGLTKGLAFFSAGRVHHHLGTVNIQDSRNLLARTPAPARGLLIGMLALGGLPPFGPFASKLMILGAAFTALSWPYTMVVLLGLTLAFVGFAKQSSILMTRDHPESRDSAAFREPWTVPLVLTVMGLLSVLLCVAGPSLVTGFFSRLVAAGGP